MGVPYYVVLLHFPISNRNGEVITTAVTNLDIHDIARSARTYGASGYFIVTPIVDQRELVNRILGHWRTEQSREYHPDRFEALRGVRLVSTFDEVIEEVVRETGERPEVVLTDARTQAQSVSYKDYRKELESPDRKQPALIVLGTGWGVSPEFQPRVDRRLYPVYGREGETGYNHLSVRAAAGVILDRLFGC